MTRRHALNSLFLSPLLALLKPIRKEQKTIQVKYTTPMSACCELYEVPEVELGTIEKGGRSYRIGRVLSIAKVENVEAVWVNNQRLNGV